MYKLISLLSVLFITACTTVLKPDENSDNKPMTDNTSSRQMYWVNSWQRTCHGVSERLCLQVQKVTEDSKQKPAMDAWQLFYAPIEDFDYELGFVYQIRVKETKLPPAQVPADASSIRYELLEMLDKTADDTLRLYDIWALTELNGENIVTPSPFQKSQQQPRLEFNLSEMKIYGSEGCNNVSWAINGLAKSELQLEPLLSTLRACPGSMKQADAFRQAMQKVKHYELSGLKLILLDANKQSILQFKKVD